jgi:hypothetical protein
MKRLTVGATLLTIAALSVAGSAAAPAMALEWLCAGAAANLCVVVYENLEPFIIEDMGASLAAECSAGEVKGQGTVGPGVGDITETLTFKVGECKPKGKVENLAGQEVANLCEKVEKVEAVGLPWTTELEMEGAAVKDLIEESILGQPGYLIECKTLLGNIEDLCRSVESKTSLLVELTNLAAEGAEPKLVNALFLKNPPAAEALKCTVGGKEDGLVIGELLIASLNAMSQLQALEFG